MIDDQGADDVVDAVTDAAVRGQGVPPRPVMHRMTPERLGVEIGLQEVRARIISLMEGEVDLLRAARFGQLLSYEVIAARLGVRRHELVVAILNGSAPGDWRREGSWS